MNKCPCEVIRDLIPLYKEGILSTATEAIIKQHLEECQDCAKYIEDDGYQPVNSALGETLPQADTFKKWSKHLKRWALYSGIVILIVILVVGAASYHLGSTDNEEPRLSLRQAVNIFADEGISLTKVSDPEAEAINGVKPTSFSINGTGNKLRIYRFESIAERINGYAIRREELYFSQPHCNAKNLLLIFVPAGQLPMSGEDVELKGRVSNIIFEKLNDTQEIVFTGTSKNWESQTVIRAFGYFYKDSRAIVHYDSYGQERTTLKYIGVDIESVGKISYKMDSPTSGASGSGSKLNHDGTLSLGASGGNTAIPSADAEYFFTIKWNDQQEAFIARSN